MLGHVACRRYLDPRRGGIQRGQSQPRGRTLHRQDAILRRGQCRTPDLTSTSERSVTSAPRWADRVLGYPIPHGAGREDRHRRPTRNHQHSVARLRRQLPCNAGRRRSSTSRSISSSPLRTWCSAPSSAAPRSQRVFSQLAHLCRRRSRPVARDRHHPQRSSGATP